MLPVNKGRYTHKSGSILGQTDRWRAQTQSGDVLTHNDVDFRSDYDCLNRESVRVQLSVVRSDRGSVRLIVVWYVYSCHPSILRTYG